MKKLQRVFALIMAIVMMMGTMSMPAFATEGESGETATVEKKFPINKTANGLDANDQTDVTLTVPGTVEGYIDVVFILGGNMNENRETIQSAINVFKPAMESGKATVRMGLISLEKGDEIILDLNTDEAILDPSTYMDFVEDKFLSIKDLPAGSTNLHSQLVEAKKMLADEKMAKPENKYLFVMATGRTYWYDNEQGNATTIITEDYDTTKKEYRYFWGIKAYQALRGRNNNLYLIPSQYKDNFDEYWKDVEFWVTEDIKNGDKYAYTVLGSKDNDNWYNAWYAQHDGGSVKVNNATHGNELINITPENFVTTGVIDGVTWGVGVQNALNYERAQYESAQVYKELVAAGYNCYAICSESPVYQNNTDRDCLKSLSHTGAYTAQVGHSFMDYLARLGGQDAAPVVWEFVRDENGNAVFKEGYEGKWGYAKTKLRENFFAPVAEDILYTCSINSTVVDYIGKNENGNFEFIEDASGIKLNVGGVDYITAMTEDTAEGSKYTFTAPNATEPTFWLDYTYGDGEITEKFVWTFGENISLERLASLTYKLQLTEKKTTDGTYTVPTNNSATLYPKDSDGNDRDPQVFPVPTVEYEVVSKVNVSVSKEWDDDNNRDGIRPEKITVILKADDEKVAEKEISAESQWTFNFTDLPAKDESGKTIDYTVEEIEVEGYESVINGNAKDGFVIENTHTPETITISGTKIWDDDSNRDGKRPASITVALMKGDEQIGEPQTVTAANQWTYSFTAYKYENGKEITNYSVKEIDVPADYETTYSEENYDITNTYEPETITIEGKKVWDDANNQDGKRPANIEVILLADGDQVAEKTVTGQGNEWSFEFTDLPKNKNVNGKVTEIVYTIAEIEVPDGYQSIPGDDNTITNKYTPGKISVTVTKKWVDGSNQDGVRPESITIILLADGEKVAEQTVTGEGDTWTCTFADLPEYANGQKIVYTVDEGDEAKAAGYTKSISGTTITNSRNVELTQVSGKKVWDDNNDQDGIRPASIVVILKADGEEYARKTVTGRGNEWAFEFTGLPKYKNGQAIEYTVDETEVPTGYTKTVSGTTITNSQKEYASVTVSGKKVWNDGNDQDGLRPDVIEVILYADGVKVGCVSTNKELDNWTFKFENLPANKDGKAIVYTVDEAEVPDGYTKTVSGTTITNTHTPATVSVEGQKIWNDGNDQDGLRPDSITIKLLADGEQVATQTVTAESQWTFEFTNLPKFNNGETIVYSISEDAVTGYLAPEIVVGEEVDGVITATVTNKHTTLKTSITVTKVWEDDNNQDGLRPSNITVKLYADGAEVEGKSVTLSANNNWTYTWTNLPANKDGKAIEYTVDETEVPTGYTKTVSGTTITNTHVSATVSVEGKKVWVDADNQDGIRPANIVVILKADGVEYDRQTVEGSGNEWTFKFTDLPANKDGKAIEYTVDEAEVPAGYTKSVSGTTITNAHTPATVSVSGTKTWIDDNNRDGLRPEEITIRLKAGGAEIDSATVSATTGWAYEFTNLPKYAAGVEIVYTITEDTVDGYTPSINGYDVTNSYTPGKTSVTVSKIWEDDNNQDGLRPAFVTVKLLADGQETGKTATLSVDNQWTATFTDLFVKEAGEAIEYTVAEVEVEGYETEITGDATIGFTITNTHVFATVSVEGKKVWVDADNQDGKRPANIVVILKADGVEYDRQTVEGSGNEWTFKFTDLPANKDGKAIVYTVDEAEVPAGYTKSVAGTTITNTHTPATVSVSGTKTWIDDNNRDGLRPEEITIRLKADGAEIDSATVSATTGWAYEFTNLPKYAAGVEIVYTITEDAVVGYEPAIDGYDVTNSYTPGKTSVSVTKVWEDGNDYDRIRPEEITVILLANGQETGKTVILSADNQWTATFTDLFVKEAGEAIEYTVAEVEVEGYETEITGDATIGFTITNTHEPNYYEEDVVTVRKVWSGDTAANRPASVTVQLKNSRTGAVQATATLSAANGWSATFYVPANEFWTVEEVNVPANYTSRVSSSNGLDFTVTNTYTTEIEEPRVPMGTPGGDTVILDDDVPLADVPKTGDPLTVMAAMSILSGAGVFFTRKKREDEE